jgi:bifunctional UDP-N-acetylglucosamine pyrophosphorylase / glucosamine-1-phosphate N-acetyltransferase
MSNRYAIVLAAGQGTRMKSSLYKVLHPVCGKPMVEHVIDQLRELKLDKTYTVVGYGAELVKEHLEEKSSFVLQEEQLGTGHAVLQVEPFLGKEHGTTIVVCGDTPLLTKETMEALLKEHEKNNAKVTILTTEMNDATGYGRIVRNTKDEVEKIVEHKDANEEELAINEVNTGTYCFDNQSLFAALKQVKNDNAQGEYYLPDVIGILKEQGEKIIAYKTKDNDETIGVNDRVALAKAEKIMRQRINEKHMRNGVTIIDPEHTYIGMEVEIESDVTILPGSTIEGKTVIKSNATIGPNSEIKNCEIGEGTVVKQSVAHDSIIGSHVQIGPFSHIRPDSNIGNNARIGNFVEVKKSSFGANSKASHLSYIGDAEVGTNVNIGCGTITVNYDGVNKHKTIIGDNVFIGCNSNLVAPVTISDGSYIAAGSTITRDVPENALAIARNRQENKEGYALKLKNRMKK